MICWPRSPDPISAVVIRALAAGRSPAPGTNRRLVAAEGITYGDAQAAPAVWRNSRLVGRTRLDFIRNSSPLLLGECESIADRPHCTFRPVPMARRRNVPVPSQERGTRTLWAG